MAKKTASSQPTYRVQLAVHMIVDVYVTADSFENAAEIARSNYSPEDFLPSSADKNSNLADGRLEVAAVVRDDIWYSVSS